MKRLGLAVVFLVASASAAFAGSGSVALYGGDFNGLGTPTCSGVLTSTPGQDTCAISIWYATNDGPEMGKAIEFAIHMSTTHAILGAPTWSPIFLTLGDVYTGISLASPTCLGAGQSYVFLGSATVYFAGATGTFTANAVPNPEEPTGQIVVTICEFNDPKVIITGGTFVFNGPCNVGVEEKTWGSIKDLYR
jgi:hypothetical protein